MANRFSARAAAFSFVSFAKSHPNFVVKYTIFYIAFMVLYCVALGAVGYFDLFKIMFAENGLENLEALNKYNSQVAPKIWLVIILSMVFYIAYKAALLRKMIRGEEIGFHGLTWGKDENRLLVSTIVWFALYMASYLAIIIFGFLVGFTAAFAFKEIPILAGVLIFVDIIACIGVFLYVLARIGQFSTISIARRKIVVMDSWNLTKGHVGSFVGSYILFFLVYTILLAVFGGFAFQLIKTELNFINLPNLIAPKWIAIGLFYSFFTALMVMSMTCIGAYAYKIMFEGEPLVEENDIKPVEWPNS